MRNVQRGKSRMHVRIPIQDYKSLSVSSSYDLIHPGSHTHIGRRISNDI